MRCAAAFTLAIAELAIWGCSSNASSKATNDHPASHADGGAQDASSGDASSGDASSGDASSEQDAALPRVKDGTNPLPNGAPGITFDDIQWAPHLRKVILPAGRTGSVFLLDPDTSEMTELKGLSQSDTYTVFPRVGSTSATEADRYIAALDGTTQTLNIFDPETTKLLSTVDLGGGPDYVYYVNSKREIWVTFTSAGRIQVYSLPASGDPKPEMIKTIVVPAGPESLAVDETRGVAYTNALFGGVTYAIDLSTHEIVDKFSNPCMIAVGITLDEERGFAFLACLSGESVSLDIKDKGKMLDILPGGNLQNLLAYNPTLKHLYAPDPNDPPSFNVMEVLDTGKFKVLGKLPNEGAGFSAVADDRGHVWTFDSANGGVVRETDTF